MGSHRQARRGRDVSTLPPRLKHHIELVCNSEASGLGSMRVDIIMLLRQLPLPQRKAVVLRAQAYSFREISALTGRCLSVVYTDTRKAEAALAEIWGRDNGYSDSTTR